MTQLLLSEADLAAGRKLMARLDAFAAFTDEPGRLTRLFLSDAHRRGGAGVHRLVRRSRPRGAGSTRPAMSSRATRAGAPARPR